MLSFFPRGVLDGILNSIESVSEGFPTCSCVEGVQCVCALMVIILYIETVVYLWGFYDIKFKLTQYKSKLGLIPQYTFDLREFDITNLKFGSNTTIYLSQHVTLTNYKPKPGLIPQHTKQTSLY